MSAQRSTVLWVTNIPTPYRVSLWREFTEHHDLVLWFAASTEHNRRWSVDLSPVGARDVRFLDARPIRWRGAHLYVPTSTVSIPHDVSTVLLGGWDSPLYWAVSAAAWRRDVPVVSFYASTGTTHTYREGPVAWVRQRMLKRASAVVAGSSAARDAVIGMGIDPSTVFTGFNSVDNAWFATRAADLRRQQSSDEPGRAFLYVGQLIERKNVVSLLEAFWHIRRPDDTLTIAGDGPERPRLEGRCRDLGISHAVHFVGHRDQEALVDLYATSHTLVLPSYEEVWGLVVNEALVCGCSVVLSDRCGAADDLRDSSRVVITEPTPSAIATAMDEASLLGVVPPDASLIPGPAEFAAVFARACTAARARHRSGRRQRRPGPPETSTLPV